MSKKKFWTSDRIVSFSAMFISLITLFIFIKQTNIIDRQSKLSAMPYLMMQMSNNGVKKTIALEVDNHGLGPAIIEEVEMNYKGKRYDMPLLDFLKLHVKEMDSVEIINVNQFGSGLAIPAEDRFNLITAGGSDKDYQIMSKAMSILISDDFNYKIIYKSVYDDRWQIESGSNAPKKLSN